MRKWRIVSQEKTANNFRAKISLENGWMCHTDPSVEWAPGRKGLRHHSKCTVDDSPHSSPERPHQVLPHMGG